MSEQGDHEAGERARLERLLYGPEGAGDAAARAAAAEALADRDAPGERTVDPGAPAAPPDSEASDASEAPAVPEAPAAPASRRLTGRLVVALAACAALGAGVATLVDHGAVDPSAFGAVSPPRATPSTMPSSEIEQALARRRITADALPASVHGGVDRSSSRLISVLTLADEPGGDSLKVFISRGTGTHTLCVIVDPEGGAPVSTCVPESTALTGRVTVDSAGPPLVPSVIVVDHGQVSARFD